MPVIGAIGAPSFVNSAVHTPLYALARSMYACTTCLQLVCPDLIAFWMSVSDFSSMWNLMSALWATQEAVSDTLSATRQIAVKLRVLRITVLLLIRRCPALKN